MKLGDENDVGELLFFEVLCNMISIGYKMLRQDFV